LTRDSWYSPLFRTESFVSRETAGNPNGRGSIRQDVRQPATLRSKQSRVPCSFRGPWDVAFISGQIKSGQVGRCRPEAGKERSAPLGDQSSGEFAMPLRKSKPRANRKLGGNAGRFLIRVPGESIVPNAPAQARCTVENPWLILQERAIESFFPSPIASDRGCCRALISARRVLAGPGSFTTASSSSESLRPGPAEAGCQLGHLGKAQLRVRKRRRPGLAAVGKRWYRFCLWRTLTPHFLSSSKLAIKRPQTHAQLRQNRRPRASSSRKKTNQPMQPRGALKA